MPGSLRLFVALPLPADVADSLTHFLTPRWEADSMLRWSPPEQWHITLAFMPAVPERVLDDLGARLERAARRRHPMELQLSGAGVFPNPYQARVLYAALRLGDEVGTELHRLARGVRAAGARAGAAPQGGRFVPHLTLARSRGPFEATRWMRIIDVWESAAWLADEIVLVSSRLGEGPGGHPAYTELGRFLLG